MEQIIHADYSLTEQISIMGKTYVMGHNPNFRNPYVTWFNPQEDYYCTGHYFDNESDARRDMLFRALELIPEQEADILANALMSEEYRSKLYHECRETDALADIESCLADVADRRDIDPDIMLDLLDNAIFRNAALHCYYHQNHSAENEALSNDLENMILQRFSPYVQKKEQNPSTLEDTISSAEERKGRGEAISSSSPKTIER